MHAAISEAWHALELPLTHHCMRPGRLRRARTFKSCCAVIGGGGTALRDFVSDAVGNATQDANYKGFYLPFYTVGTGAGVLLHSRLILQLLFL